MSKVEASIDVNVPVTTAYNQWTQFEDFPKFMKGVKEIRQADDKTLEWHASIAGNDERWTAEIEEQEPDTVVAWRSTSGVKNSGRVVFEPIDEKTTRVNVTMEWNPEGPVQKAGDVLGFDQRQVEGDLERFKEFIESRGTETGAWRGEIKENTTVS
jgi:uncharacterized membrane protein